MKTTLMCVFALFTFALTEPSSANGKIVHDDFSVEYGENVPEAAAELVADRVEAALKLVRAYLAQAPSYSGSPYDWPMKVVIDPDRFGPYQLRNEIYLPEAHGVFAIGPNGLSLGQRNKVTMQLGRLRDGDVKVLAEIGVIWRKPEPVLQINRQAIVVESVAILARIARGEHMRHLVNDAKINACVLNAIE